MKYNILEQRFPKKLPDGSWGPNWRQTGVVIEAESGEEALAAYRSARSVCINPLAAEPAKEETNV